MTIRGQDGAVLPRLGSLVPLPVADRPDLLAPAVAAFLATWEHAAEMAVVEIDPDLADTAQMTEHYGLSLLDSVNCVLVAGTRAGDERIAACAVRADTRADVNQRARRLLDVRKASFLAMERATGESGMDYGGITPVGLPGSWRLLLDDRVVGIEVAIIGSGVRRAKLLLPGRLLAELPGAEVVAGLAG